jgi:hypothetical protein
MISTIQTATTPAPIPKLCPKLIEDPQDIATSHNLKGFLYRTAALISALAIVVIFAGITALYLGMIPDLPTWAAAAALVSAMIFLKGMGLWSYGTQQYDQANEYQQIADKMILLSQEGGLRDWTVEQIEAFFREQNLQLPRSPEVLEALQRRAPYNYRGRNIYLHLERDHAFLALRPLIARYKVLGEQAEKLKEIYEQNLRGALELNFPNNAVKEELELMHWFSAMNTAEELAFTRLKSAIILQNLQFPDRDYSFQAEELNGESFPKICLMELIEDCAVGVLRKKSKETRAIDYIANRPRVFFEGITGNPIPPITLDDFIGSEPKQIRARIFDQLAANLEE